MKKIFLLLLLMFTLTLSSCTVVKIKRFYEFASSEAMDIEITKYTDAGSEVIDLKYNTKIMIISMDDVSLAMDFKNDIVYVDYYGLKVYTVYELCYFEHGSENTDMSNYVSNIKSIDDYLSFELDKKQLKMDQDKETDETDENIICKVMFEEKRVSSIEMLPLDSEEPEYTIKVNAYGDEVEGIELPSENEYSRNYIYDMI